LLRQLTMVVVHIWKLKRKYVQKVKTLSSMTL
jgi:hypothetical protein